MKDSPFPSCNQELLLKAALFSGQHMLDAWFAWKSHVNYEEDMDKGSSRLLPLLFHNLVLQKMNDPIMQKMKLIYIQAWSKNHFLFQKASQVISLIQRNNIPVMVLKGIPLTLQVYKNHAVRPMHDMDLLVPYRKKEETIAMLTCNGWQPMEPWNMGHNLKFSNGVGFTDAQNNELDLHWHPVFEIQDAIIDADFWAHAIPLEVAGVKTLAMCNTDNLFHAIIHGMRCNDEPPIRWVADSVNMIRLQSHPIDWNRILKHATRFRATLQMKDALYYLSHTFHAEVPLSLLEQLNATDVHWTDRLVYKHALTKGEKIPPERHKRLLYLYTRYLRQSSKKNIFTIHAGFLRYLWHLLKGRPQFVLNYRNMWNRFLGH